ncbi:hypothetical protein PP940_gp217 [Rhizobium phage RL2RES]|uniref:DUF2188 domain-containing protein n=1 Tax=Rhizobium phage RL2RES TaxID=103371 RepID=A0A6B9J3U7_9CAUD|nr:hypothetical protein PP940_gp217 [Rhizobium phage RL2RES]QGZ14312.1 hypothetical protein RL2RES_217 [Rhizobium phage RL2RES]
MKFKVYYGERWWVVSSLRERDGTFDTYDEGQNEATRLNYKLAVERCVIDEQMPGAGNGITYRMRYEGHDRFARRST